MGIQERRDRERQEVRDKILDAARELFASQGYDAVTMRGIAEKIEYSPTAIYLHFADKEALLHEICDADFRALARSFQAIGRISDPIERLRAIGLAYSDFGLTHPNHYRLMFMTPHPPVTGDDVTLRKGNPEEDAYAFLRATIVEALAAGRFRPEFTDAEELSQIVWAGVHGVVSLWIAKRNDGWIEWHDVRTNASKIVDAMIRGLTV